MGKTATSQRRKASMSATRKYVGRKDNAPRTREYKPTEELLNPEKIGGGIMECLLNDDPEGAMEIIEIYLDTVNRVQMARNSHIPRSTLYHSLKHKNPTIKTLAKLMHASVVNKVA